MYRFFAMMVVAAYLWFQPNVVAAAEHRISFQLVRQDDQLACGEFWYNDQMIWRITLMQDYVRPVFLAKPMRTTFIIPDIMNGMFTVKIHGQ